MADYLVEIDYEARYTIAYKIAAESDEEAEAAAENAVAGGEELPILERRVHMRGGYAVNRRETRPLSEADADLLAGVENDGLLAAA